jgi:hypothetical protein
VLASVLPQHRGGDQVARPSTPASNKHGMHFAVRLPAEILHEWLDKPIWQLIKPLPGPRVPEQPSGALLHLNTDHISKRAIPAAEALAVDSTGQCFVLVSELRNYGAHIFEAWKAPKEKCLREQPFLSIEDTFELRWESFHLLAWVSRQLHQLA